MAAFHPLLYLLVVVFKTCVLDAKSHKRIEDHFNTSLITTQKSLNFFFLVQLQDIFSFKERKVKTMVIIFVYACILI